MIKQLINRLFKTKRTSVRTTTNDSVTYTELQEMILSTRIRLRGLNSTVKQFTAMEDSVEKGRKRHYAKLKDAAQNLLTQCTIELETLEQAELRFAYVDNIITNPR